MIMLEHISFYKLQPVILFAEDVLRLYFLENLYFSKKLRDLEILVLSG